MVVAVVVAVVVVAVVFVVVAVVVEPITQSPETRAQNPKRRAQNERVHFGLRARGVAQVGGHERHLEGVVQGASAPPALSPFPLSLSSILLPSPSPFLSHTPHHITLHHSTPHHTTLHHTTLHYTTID